MCWVVLVVLVAALVFAYKKGWFDGTVQDARDYFDDDDFRGGGTPA